VKQEQLRSRVFVIAGLALGIVSLVGTAAASDQARLGFFGGLNRGNMGGDMDRFGNELAAEFEEIGGTWAVTKGAKTGPGFGAYYYWPRSPRLGFQFEAHYARRGVNFDLEGRIEEFEIVGDLRLKLDYFELPLLLRIAPLHAGDQRLVFMAGPVIGFRTAANLAAEIRALGQTSSESEDYGGSFKSMILGAVVAVGVTGEIDRRTSFVLQARYHAGLMNAFDDPEFSSRSSDFGIYVGMEFALGQ